MKCSTVNVTEKHHVAILVIYFLLKKIMKKKKERKSCRCFIMLRMPLLFTLDSFVISILPTTRVFFFFFFSNAGGALSSFNKMNLSVCSYIISIVKKKKKGSEILIVEYRTTVTKHFAFELRIQRSF